MISSLNHKIVETQPYIISNEKFANLELIYQLVNVGDTTIKQ